MFSALPLHSNFMVRKRYNIPYVIYVDIIIDINPGLIMVLVIFTGL